MTPTGSVDRNLAEIARLAEAAADQGAELVVFPERALTGLEDPAETAIAVTAAPITELTALARRFGVFLLVGFAEREGERCFNGSVLAGPAGILACYRQIHLTAADAQWAVAGRDWTVFDLPFARVGLLIGHDLSFPEAGRVLALKGCDLLACPAAVKEGFHLPHEGTSVPQPEPIPTSAAPIHWHQYRVRAGENNCWLAFANVRAPATGYAGLSGVFGPDTFQFPDGRQW